MCVLACMRLLCRFVFASACFVVLCVVLVVIVGCDCSMCSMLVSVLAISCWP